MNPIRTGIIRNRDTKSLYVRMVGIGVMLLTFWGTVSAQKFSFDLDSLAIQEATSSTLDSAKKVHGLSYYDFTGYPPYPKPANLDSVMRLMMDENPILYEVEGTAIIKILVDTTGKHLKHIIIKEVHPLFKQVIDRNLKYCTFQPILNDEGRPFFFWTILALRINERH